MHSSGVFIDEARFMGSLFLILSLLGSPSLYSSCSFLVFCAPAPKASKTETRCSVWEFSPPLIDLTIFYLFLILFLFVSDFLL